MFADLGEVRRTQVSGDPIGVSSFGSAGDPGCEGLTGVVCGDSSAAIAISQRKGCGKLRHINIGQLWIQEKVNAKELEVRKVLGEENQLTC